MEALLCTSEEKELPAAFFLPSRSTSLVDKQTNLDNLMFLRASQLLSLVKETLGE